MTTKKHSRFNEANDANPNASPLNNKIFLQAFRNPASVLVDDVT
jgi:hypothetical protein